MTVKVRSNSYFQDSRVVIVVQRKRGLKKSVMITVWGLESRSQSSRSPMRAFPAWWLQSRSEKYLSGNIKWCGSIVVFEGESRRQADDLIDGVQASRNHASKVIAVRPPRDRCRYICVVPSVLCPRFPHPSVLLFVLIPEQQTDDL